MNLVRMNFIANMELQYCGVSQPSGFLPVQHSARSRGHSSDPLLDRSAGSKTDPIEMTVIDRALCAVDLAR
eukprot:COSAG01_NODE_4566_length_4918_cov_6.112056_1_plen_71_part_00